jgi:protoheme IX farnesyltransferase
MASTGDRGLVAFGRVSAVAAGVTWLLILLGGAVCFTGSAKAIPDWPTSFGRLIPPAGIGALIEYVHRVLAAAAGALIAAMAVLGLLRFRRDGWRLALPPLLAVGFLVVVSIFGARAVLSSLTPAMAVADLGSALAVLALTVATAAAAFLRQAQGRDRPKPRLRDPLALLALGSCAGVFLALALSVAVGSAGVPSTCLGWPAWTRAAAAVHDFGAAAVVLYAASAAATLFIAAGLVAAWRSRTAAAGVLPAWTLAAVLFFSGLLTAELAAARGFPLLLLALRVALASGAWAALIGLLVLCLRLPGARFAPRPAPGRRLLDLIRLTRPGVTLLLLAAAAAGSIAGYRGVPPLGLLGWTLLGLAMASGGAQALNQYIERETDARMARTANRPLPSGRLSPAEGLAWGLGLCLASLAVMAVLVSGRAALLTLAGQCWYVLLYTLVLKRRTPQSIVIGGLAGSLLPVIGSVAASGRLAASALFLGLSIFLWTPPHFWTYALLHLEDYSGSGLPVAPLVYGVRQVWRAILAYTAALVLSTFLPVLFRSAGPPFLGAALVLGGLLLAAAGGAWRRAESRPALRLYRFLSLYLGLLLAASAVDALLPV